MKIEQPKVSKRESEFLQEIKKYNLKFHPCYVESIMAVMKMSRPHVWLYVDRLKKIGLIEIEENEIYAMI